MSIQSRLRIALCALTLVPALACNLGAAATPPAATLAAPLLTIQPVTGAPGTLITLRGAGYPPNASLNLYLNASVSQGAPFAAVHTDASGNVITTLTLPPGTGGTNFGDGQSIVFSLVAISGASSASALFLVEGTGTPAAAITPGVTTPGQQATTDLSGSGGVFITEPGMNVTLSGLTVAVAGSAPAGAVTVEVQNASNGIIGSAQTTSVMQVGQSTGTWEATVAFTQPISPASGYIVALADGQQASIPVTFSGSAIIPSLAVGTAQAAVAQP